ncbi:MAG: 2,3-bisphosphoglycerate-independent phosphoglycerate mutase [Raoultibacter sp.]
MSTTPASTPASSEACREASSAAPRKNPALRTPVCLVIMDGFGLAEPGPANAISQAHTPCLDKLFATCPAIELDASQEAVGLPAGQMGNSEVGHLNIGAGRTVYQELTRINRACADGSLEHNKALNEAIEVAKKPGAALHVMGLLSDGGVHSSNQHLYALVRHAVSSGVADIRIHCFLDGRDVAPRSGLGYLKELQAFLTTLEGGSSTVSLASIEGRYFAMDRDNRWDRVAQAYDAIVCGTPQVRTTPLRFVSDSYAQGVTDEFVVPASLDGRGMRDGDAVVFFNFRPDRARELTHAIIDDDFAGFTRTRRPRTHFVCLTQYDAALDVAVAFPKQFPQNVLADVLATAGLAQYHIAETEKYAHVTFFFNGGEEKTFPGEDRVLVPSPTVATFDLKPEMSAYEVTDAVLKEIEQNKYDVIILNFANCDMVGHTGSVAAAIRAVEALDAALERVLAALERVGGVALITADHGNADKMAAADGTPFTAHTTAPVPLLLVDCAPDTSLGLRAVPTAALSNIAPTLLAIIGLEIPAEMDAESLLLKGV